MNSEKILNNAIIMIIARNLLILFMLILNYKTLLNWTVSSSEEILYKQKECDYNKYKNGCQDGSD